MKKNISFSNIAAHCYQLISLANFILLSLLIFNTPLIAKDSKPDSVKMYKIPSVTVTADRAEEGKSPVPFSNLTKAEIEKTYTFEDLPEMLTELPSIISYSESGNNIGYSYLTMRGFSQHRIAVFVNGIPQNDPEDHGVYWIDMPDIASNVDNIQVQRGAGMVNYGAASIGGSINLTTSNFVNKRGINVYSGIGFQEYGANGTTYQPTMSKYSIEMSSGMVDNYAVYGRLSRINSDGYRDNMWAELNSYFFSAVRFDDNFTTQINVFGGPLSDGLGYTGLPKEYIKNLKLRRTNPSYWEYNSTSDSIAYFVPRIKQEVEEFSQPHYELLNDWNINDNLTLHSSLFYYTGDGYFDYSGSGWAEEYLKDYIATDFDTSALSISNPLIRGAVENKHGGWIPRINWKHNSGVLSLGAEIRVHRSDHWGKLIYSESLPENYDQDFKFYSNNGEREILSVFAAEHFDLTKKLTVSAEAQLVRQSYRLANIKKGSEYLNFLQIDGNTRICKDDMFDINHIFFNPRLGFNYRFTDKMNLYSMLAFTSREPRMKNYFAAEEAYYGAMPQFKSDTINGEIGYDFTAPLVIPESMFDFELGWNLRQEKFNIKANAYWMEYFDELASTGIVDIWGHPVDGNVPRSRHIGLELQSTALLMSNKTGKLMLSANATLSSNKIIEFDFVTSLLDTVSLEGNSIAGFPDIMGGFRLSYQYENLYTSVSGRYVGEFRTDNFGDMISEKVIQDHLSNDWNVYRDNVNEAYFLLNADLSYTFRNILSLQTLKLQLKINNILNKLYSAYGIGKTFFPAAERNIFIGLELGL
jgi:iron complex outermembrane recepter protein